MGDQNQKYLFANSDCASQLSRRLFITKSLIASVGLAALPAVISSPAHADLVPLPSVDEQKKVGLQAAQQVLKQYKQVRDIRDRELNYVGQKLVDALPEPDKSRWDYKFHLIDSKELNAFALPGGNLFFFTGLYDHFTTEDELAGVVGHEMTHVRKEHWAHAYQKQQERSLFISLGLSIFHANNAAQTVAGAVDQAISLKYSRNEEAQADQGGLEDMSSAGYNPQGMIDMFNVLLKNAGNGDTLGSDFLSNHPLTTDRIKAAQSQINQIKSKTQFPPERKLTYSIEDHVKSDTKDNPADRSSGHSDNKGIL